MEQEQETQQPVNAYMQFYQLSVPKHIRDEEANVRLKMEVVYKQRREVSQLKAKIREMTKQSGVEVDNGYNRTSKLSCEK